MDSRRGRGRLSAMEQVPEEAQDDIIWAIGELNKRERSQADILFELNDRLAVKGVDPISSSAFNRKSMKLAAAMNRLAEARHIFAGIADQFTPEKVDENTLVIGEFIKMLVFELAQADASERTPKEAMELARAHLAVIQGQNVSSKRRVALEDEFKAKAAKAIDKVAGAKGLSAETRDAFKRDLFGVRE